MLKQPAYIIQYLPHESIQYSKAFKFTFTKPYFYINILIKLCMFYLYNEITKQFIMIHYTK